jgi:hypothetical protein
MGEKIKIQVCLDCVRNAATGKRQVPCLDLHRRASAKAGKAVLGLSSCEVGGGKGHCPWIATWPEVIDVVRDIESNNRVYASPTAQTTLRRIRQASENY